MKLVIVEGLISSGKTTLAPRLVEYLNTKNHKAVFVPEPVDEWKSSGKLAQFYSDIATYAFDFHMYTLKTMFETLQRAINEVNTEINEVNTEEEVVFVAERSIFSVKHMFFQNLVDLGHITPTQLHLFNIKYTEFIEKMPKPDLFIWLDTPLETCMDRVCSRNRENESTQVTREYQQLLWRKHEAFFKSKEFKSQYKLAVSPQISLDYRTTPGHKSHEADFFDYIILQLQL